MKGISVVIPCFNEVNYIASCLDGLIHNGFPLEELEILVVDGGSSDGTIDILTSYCQKFTCVKHIQNELKKTPFALNLGVRNASFGYVLIAGAHAEYPKNYLNSLYSQIQNEDIDVIGGGLETKTKKVNKITEAICFVLSHPFGVGNSTFRTGASEITEVDTVPFGLYKKGVFNEVGMYNEKLIRNHDIELSRRIKANGYSIWLDPTLKCTYYARETLKGLAKNNYSNGLWILKTVFITKHFSSLSVRHFIPLLFLLSITVPVIIGFFFSYVFVLISVLSLMLYLFVISIISVKSKYNFINVVVAFIILHLSYGLGSLVGALSLIKIKTQ